MVRESWSISMSVRGSGDTRPCPGQPEHAFQVGLGLVETAELCAAFPPPEQRPSTRHDNPTARVRAVAAQAGAGRSAAATGRGGAADL